MDAVKLASEHFFKGLDALNRGDLKAAEGSLLTALEIVPDRPSTLCNLAIVYLKMERYDEALACCDRAISVKPDFIEAHYNRGSVLKEMGRLNEALASCDKAIDLKPDFAEAYTLRGNVLKSMGQRGEALLNYNKAVGLKPDDAKTRLGLAAMTSETGSFAEAEEQFRKILSLDPRNVDALCRIAEIRKFKANEPLIKTFERSISDQTLPDESRARLHYAYAKICNDLGRYDDAITHFSLGKALKRLNFDLGRHGASYSVLKTLFTRQFFADRRNFGLADERPVFIVGMPRSGTTLVEQILASHSRIQGLGELRDMARIANELGWGWRNLEPFTDAVSKLQARDIRKMAEQYCEAYSHSDPKSIRLIDKLPHNFEMLGLIALMFPKAHIIHCRRNVLDNCVSLYMQDFTRGHSYNKDFITLGHYYRAYEDLMSHWHEVLPLPIQDCVYEDIVRDFEVSVRDMVAFVGVEWDPKCLNYHEQDRLVTTPSHWQVRQPLYGNSVERWRRYEKHLGPLKEALGIS